MSNRRSFLKKLGLLSASTVFNKQWALASEKPLLLGSQKLLHSNSDKYWQMVQSAFHIEKGYNYFNNGTMGPSPAVVEQAVIQKVKKINSNLNYGGGEDCRDSIAELIGAKANEISITHNTTEGLNVAAWGLPLSKNDEVIITSHEHVGNAMPWLNRRAIDGIKVNTFKPALNANKVLEQINSLITRKTRVISIPHISCTIGQRFPVKQVCQLAKEKGIYTVIDGAHGAGGLNLNMQDIDPDIYVSCGHKWMLGPKGTGFIYIPERMFDIVKPIFAGAYTDSGFDITVNPPTLKGYSQTAHRYDYGTQNAALKIGLKAAADFHLEIGAENVEKRIIELNEYLYHKLIQNDSISVLSSTDLESRSMMLGFKHKTLSYQQVAKGLQKHRIRIRQVPESGVDCIRVSTHIYNSFDQIDYMVDQIEALN
ncbi:MAG: aminotransferase class V-fold PLP-dependent enzyme [Bacteroidia bacterium]